MLRRKFDLYFIQRWTFAFSDICLTQRSSCESYSSNWSQDFCALPKNRQRFLRLDVLRHTTQLSYIFRCCALLSPPFFGLLLGCSSTFQCGNEHSAPTLQQIGHSGGCQWSQGNLVHVLFTKFLHGCRLLFPGGLRLLRFLFLDALLPLCVCGTEDGAVLVSVFHAYCRRARNDIGLPLNICPFSFHW